MNTPAELDTISDRLTAAARVSREGARAVRLVMARWKTHRWVPVFLECPHCGALCASRAAKIRHRQREARIELALRELGLLEPGLDIRIATSNDYG